MVAVVIVTIAALGIMVGTVHAKGELRALQVRERATFLLENYTDYWRGRVADGNISPAERNAGVAGETVYLYGDANSEDKVVGKLYYDIYPEPSKYAEKMIERFRVATRIEWDDHVFSKNNVQKERRLETVMVEFKFQ